MSRLNVLKTYKLFIGGQFPRTESGRYYEVKGPESNLIANMCLSSRKDFRNAVVAARGAFSGWAGKSAFNRSQIIYRIAEILEGRKEQFMDELALLGYTTKQAQTEIELSIDRLVYYAGWADKFQQLFSSVNPVASPHFNFSVPEPMGVVSIVAPETNPLLGLISTIIPVIVGGNTCVVLASEKKPTCAISFAEIIATSDVPGGVINILTGTSQELLEHMASHMDVNATIYCRNNKADIKLLQERSATNVKRSFIWQKKWENAETENPYLILDAQEIKTTWHPIENIDVSGAKY